uniref:Myosin VIIBa n=1 Tax=Gadus morhua TaxID=8049 RepID=A0A8C5FSW9_GADMO
MSPRPQGDYVWLDSGTGVPIGARVKESEKGKLQLVDDEGKEQAALRPMHPTSVEGVEDMIRLGDLTEAGLLRNLLVRHKEGSIYTYTGSILVAVNPYKVLPIYTAEQVHMYTDRRLGELPPHVFAIADSCFFNMRRSQKNQCCVISGESGAGKTESAKLMLQYLAAVSGQRSWIEQQILEANPILEAFGNAKTIRNDNSSRFGKYIDINFNTQGAIEGARIEQYLLEKSRVCRQAPEERNYHIFYYMLVGMTPQQKTKLSLGNASDYNYLTMGKCTTCEGRDDITEYTHFLSALKILMFSDSDSWEISRLLAAILHLGNVKFEGHADNLEGCDIIESTHFNMAAKLMEVRLMLVFSSVPFPSCCRPRSAQAIYGRLFIWVVDKINSAVFKPLPEDSEEVHQCIGLLDIFGFENFVKNSFEQLCINFANEQLQQFFVRHVFKLEQEEYSREGVVWTHIEYNDNQRTLDVLASKPLNILALIDEESSFPKGTDRTMMQKVNKQHGKGDIYMAPKNDHEKQFGIRHFAGVVFYDSQGFLEKNRDALSADVIELVETSTNQLLKQAFKTDLAPGTARGGGNSRMTMTTPKNSLRLGPDGKKRSPTLIGQFRKSLEALMKALAACQPYFIRCIKPNDLKQPEFFDRDLCMRQLRYSGMMETIKIRKAGFPIRYSFQEFLERFRVLLNTATCDPKTESTDKCCETICKTFLSGEGHWRRGRSKIFLKDFHDTMLELERMKKLNEKALVIQRVLRGLKYRKQFLRKKAAALMIQKHWRGHQGRKIYRIGLTRLQARVRSRQMQHKYQKKREAATVLQARVRGINARKEWRRQKAAVVLLQAYTRGALARRRRAEELASLERQRRLNEALRRQREADAKAQDNPLSDHEMVDYMFQFLPPAGGDQEGQGPDGFKDLEQRRMVPETVDLDELPMEEQELSSDEEDDLDEYSFSKFASMSFQGAATATHVRHRLAQPLIHHEDEGDVQASLTVWWIILRFMGDLPEPKQRVNPLAPGGAGSRGANALPQDLASRNDRRLSHMVGLDQSDSSVALSNEMMAVDSTSLERPMTALEKLHIIVGYAIVRRDLRDEIYCQICKQLEGNNNKNSYYRGWILLSLCLGIFPPTEKFIKYLQSFIRSGPGGYGPYCVERLKRTASNGVRGEPPSWLELQATKTKKRMTVTLTLMDGRTISVPVDSASTSGEICQMLSQKVQLKDSFGFSVYVALYEKVWALGSGREHVMDAISQCEQEVRRKGGQEQHAPWRLYFRKEVFAPWHNCKDDAVSTELIYRQVIRGLKFGEYQCRKVSASVWAAQSAAVQDAISSSLLEAKPEDKWIQMVNTAHTQVGLRSTRHARPAAATAPPRGWTVTRLTHSGPALAKSRFIVAINWTGITFLDERERRLVELSYPEVTGVNTVRWEEPQGVVSTVRWEGPKSLNTGAMTEDLAALVLVFLAGLRERSQYGVALKDASSPDDATLLSFKKGELLELLKDKEFSLERGWLKARNDRTGKSGAVPAEALLILPTLSKPTNQVMVPHLYLSYQNHLPTVMSKNAGPERLWVHSREPLRLPLLRRLANNADHSTKACLAFTYILPYMGDYPTKQSQSSLELTDQIFGAATQNEALRDEIYCQIMKQMTSNNNRFSLEQGWQLLWLCCGLFPPGPQLSKHAQRFLESRERQPLAADCLKRLQSSRRTDPRKLPPHQVEVEAIQQNSIQIFHKIHFPNDTEDVMEVATSTRVRDLVQSISEKLGLISADGFSVFVKTPDTVLSLNEADYFFDSLRQITDWSKNAKRVNEVGGPVSVSYMVFFMRKLWYNVIPGRDLEADLIFHYPQELPKYMRGYHVVTKEEMVHIGALLFRIKTGGDSKQLAVLPKLLKEILPADQIKAFSENEWKKTISAAYNKQAEMTSEEAMLEFLKAVYRWQTFGAAFFDVKQTSDRTFPDIVRIAISKTGVAIIHPKTKEVLATHAFNRIASWCSGSTYFHMTLGSLVQGSKFLCETSLVSPPSGPQSASLSPLWSSVRLGPQAPPDRGAGLRVGPPGSSR